MPKEQRLRKRGKIQKIIQMWKDTPQSWIQSADLRSELVLSYNKDWNYNENLNLYVNVNDPKDKRAEKPLPYASDGEMYKDLKLLVEAGILENKKVLQDRGKDKSYYRLSEKHRLEPLKNHYASLIKNKNIEHIYPGLEHMLLLPENLTAKEFLEKGTLEKSLINTERAVLFEEVFDRFFSSVRLILLDARLEKAKGLWTIKINSKNDIYPPLKLSLWTELLTSQIIIFSPMLRDKTAYDKIPDLKEKLQGEERFLQQMIFQDICHYFRYHPKDIKKMNDRIQSNFKDNIKYLNRVWNELHKIIEEKEFGVVISPTAFMKPTSDFSDGFEWLLKEKEKDELIKVQRSGKKRVIHKTTMKELGEKNPFLFELQPSEAEKIGIERGKYWFDEFSPATRMELKNFCNNLGYSDNEMYRMLGLFIFPLPVLTLNSRW